MSNIKKFPLTCRDGRVALLIGITAGSVGTSEIETAVIRDIEQRPYRKPVVANDIFYDSVSDAARAEVGNRTKGLEAHRLVMNATKRISRWCTADNVEGYYWAEPQ